MYVYYDIISEESLVIILGFVANVHVSVVWRIGNGYDTSILN